MKSAEAIVEILEAFDLTGSYRAAAALAGCSHHTVARYVRLRAAGEVLSERAARDQLIDRHLAKLEEWVERSRGKVRADVVHDKLVALGCCALDRSAGGRYGRLCPGRMLPGPYRLARWTLRSIR